MKRMWFYWVSVMLLTACTFNQVTIVVENPADFDRKGELVEVDVSELAVNFHTALYILKDKKGVEVPYQLTYEDGGAGTLVFPVDMQAGASAAYRLTKGVPAEVKPKTYARYIPERKDDLAWENDLAAYRVYGPALAGEDPGNGTDLWLKRTDELIVDKFYHDELKNGLSYHVDHGQGLDCYKVGRTLGAGGIAPYTSRLWTGNPYTAQKVMFTGPLRSVFMLTYDSARVENRVYRQSVTITVDAGSLMNKAVVRYEGYEGDATPFKLAGGIFLHDGDGAEFIDAAYQAIAYAEEAVSDAGLPSGRNYVAVYMPGGKDAARTDGHLILTADYKPGETFTYYFGGGWSKWKFPSDNDWFKAVERFGRMKKEPLQVTVNKGSAS